MMTTMTAQTTQVYQLYIRATPEQVWDAITNPETIAKYFHGAQIDDGPLEVGAARKSWSPDRSQLWGDNTILECDPPHRYVHTWRSLYDEEMAAEDESRVTWEIEAADGGTTRLTLIHDRLEGAPKTAANVTGWSYILSNLKTVLETGEPFAARE
jgi:uncharacterized protein YndB with AHSA1/START domain